MEQRALKMMPATVAVDWLCGLTAVLAGRRLRWRVMAEEDGSQGVAPGSGWDSQAATYSGADEAAALA